MKKLIGVLFALAVVALAVPAAPRPVAGAPAADPAHGAVAMPSYALICNSILKTGDAGPDKMGPGSVAMAACYGPKLAPGTSVGPNDIHIIWPTNGTGGTASAVGGSNGWLCNDPAEVDMRRGIYGVSCVARAETNVSTVAPPRPGDSPYLRVSVRIFPSGCTSCGMSESGTVPAVTWDRRGIATTSATFPEFPPWWPVGVTPVDPVEGGGELPEYECTVAQRKDFDGTVRANVRSKVLNPSDDATDEVGVWQYEWEIASGSLFLEHFLGAEVLWSTAPKHRGRVIKDLTVPDENRPARGWVMRYTTVRTYEGQIGVDVPNPEWWERASEGSSVDINGGSVYMGVEPATRWLFFDNIGEDDEVNTVDSPEARANLMQYALEDADSVTQIAHPTAWVSATVRCATNARPGVEEAVTIVEPGGPTGPGGGPEAPEGPGGGGGGGGAPKECGGLSLNPISWWETLSCGIADALAGLFDFLGDLLGELIGLIEDLLEVVTDIIDWMTDLVMPDWDGFGRLASIQAAASERGPLAWGSSLATMMGSLRAGYSGDYETSGDHLTGPCLEFHPLQEGSVGCNPPGGWWTVGRHMLSAMLIGMTILTIYRNLMHSMDGDSE